MKYSINEIFYSLQGEGFNQGKRVIFIRLSGCNLTCSWCDTDFSLCTEMSVENIISKLGQWHCKSVIITGGEPSVQDLQPLVRTLKEKDYWIGIESNATRSLATIEQWLDYIALSPKKNTPVAQFKASEVRMVNEGLTEEMLLKKERLIQADHYFISPLEKKGKMNILECMHLLAKINVISRKGWLISLQLHKLTGIR